MHTAIKKGDRKIMNQLQVFNYQGQEVRTVEKDGSPWWVLKDVCDVLGISNATVVASRLDPDEVTKFDLGGLSGESNVVNEAGLYNVILRSDKPEAKDFKRWVTHEVLPTIRRHGAYLTPEKVEEALLNPDTIINLATQLKEERQQRAALEETVERQRPKVLFADAVEASSTSILVGDLAKLMNQNGVDIGQNRLFNRLRRDGYLCSRHGDQYNLPTQRAMDMGLFEVKVRTISNPDGSVKTTRTTKVTGKGQIYFIEKYCEKHPEK